MVAVIVRSVSKQNVQQELRKSDATKCHTEPVEVQSYPSYSHL